MIWSYMLFNNSTTTYASAGITCWLAYKIINTFMDDDGFTNDILIGVSTSNTPLIGSKCDSGISIGIRLKVSNIAFVIAIRTSPFTVRLVGWVPVASR